MKNRPFYKRCCNCKGLHNEYRPAIPTRPVLVFIALSASFLFLAGCGGGMPGTNQQGDPCQNGDTKMTWSVKDACNDGQTIQYRFFNENNGCVIPSSSTVYDINYGQTLNTDVNCNGGAKICFGGQAGQGVYGVGLNNSSTCADPNHPCCFSCADTLFTFELDCQ